MRRRTIVIIVIGVVIILVSAGTIGWYVYDRTSALTAAEAGERLEADAETLVSELGLREATPAIAAGEDCGVWSGSGEQLNDEPRRQHWLAVDALPPAGRAATGLAPDAEAILRRLDYRIITDEILIDPPPPPGTVIATGGRDDVLWIELRPDPAQDTVRVSGSARCLPI